MGFVIVLLGIGTTNLWANSEGDIYNNTFDRDKTDNIYGSIKLIEGQARAFVVNDSEMEVSGGLASYLKVDDDVSTQKLYRFNEFKVDAKSKVEVTVEVPCWTQVDLFKGNLIPDLSKERYDLRLIAAAFNVNECLIVASPTPICTDSPKPTIFVTPSSTMAPTPTLYKVPSVTPSIAPVITSPPLGGPPAIVTSSPISIITSTPVPVVINTPNPVVSNTPVPITYNTPAPKGEVLGKMKIPEGATLPVTGKYDFNYSLYISLLVLTLGFGLRFSANYLDKIR